MWQRRRRPCRRLELGPLQAVRRLALRYDAPLIAANLSNADTSRIVRGGCSMVFEAEIAFADLPVAPEVQAAQERDRIGHCHSRRERCGHMAQAQYVMTPSWLIASPGRRAAGVVLLAGNGRAPDLGVPRWLGTVKDRMFAVATWRSPTTRRRSGPSTRWFGPQWRNVPILVQNSRDARLTSKGSQCER
jgi:hypothetical protein